MVDVNAVTGEIVDTGLELHRQVGPGLLESVYAVVLASKLERRGLRVERQCPVDFEVDGIRFENMLKIDLLVERRVVVELKSVETVAAVHKKQVLTYMRLLELPVGLLMNFGAATLTEGLHRIINNRWKPDAREFNRAARLPTRNDRNA